MRKLHCFVPIAFAYVAQWLRHYFRKRIEKLFKVYSAGLPLIPAPNPAMTTPIGHIGIFGTFDVENYGDLLFPLIAQAELTKRLGRVKVRAFSYNEKKTTDWPYEVTSMASSAVAGGDNQSGIGRDRTQLSFDGHRTCLRRARL